MKLLDSFLIFTFDFNRLSKGKMLTNVQRQTVSDFLVSLTNEIHPIMLLKLLRQLTVDLANLNEYSNVALRVIIWKQTVSFLNYKIIEGFIQVRKQSLKHVLHPPLYNLHSIGVSLFSFCPKVYALLHHFSASLFRSLETCPSRSCNHQPKIKPTLISVGQSQNWFEQFKYFLFFSDVDSLLRKV